MRTLREPTTKDGLAATRSPYTDAFLDDVFARAAPSPQGSLRCSDVISSFRAHRASVETAMRAGGVLSTRMLIFMTRDGELVTLSNMTDGEAQTAVGKAAWRRQRRLAWYLWQAVRSDPTLLPLPPLLADLDDLSDDPNYSRDAGAASTDGHVPVFASNGGVCGCKIAVPIPLKGFGTTDLEHRLASNTKREPVQYPRHHPPPVRQLRQPEQSMTEHGRGSYMGWPAVNVSWRERSPLCVWRGSARLVTSGETCSATARMDMWSRHPRGRLVALSREHPQLLDAGYSSLEKLRTGHNASKDASSTTRLRNHHVRPSPTPPAASNSLLRPPMGWYEQAKHRCLIEMDGHGYQGSLAAKMLTGAAVISQASQWPLWFQFPPLLQHKRHYLVVPSPPPPGAAEHGSNLLGTSAYEVGILRAMRWVHENENAAHAMAKRGVARILSLLAPGHLIGYVAGLLLRYRRLFAGLDPSEVVVPCEKRLLDLRSELCGDRGEHGATRARFVCRRYNTSAPPPRFAAREAKSKAEEKRGWEGKPESHLPPLRTAAQLRHRLPSTCPAAGRYGDSPSRRCDRWCERVEHCSWCKCALCPICASGGGTRTTDLQRRGAERGGGRRRRNDCCCCCAARP